MLQFAKGSSSKTVLGIEKESESALCKYLNSLVEQWKQAVEPNEISAVQGMNEYECVRANKVKRDGDD
jgi:hypothetical protein